MKPAQINFVKECLPAAVSAGAAFNLNPLVILAQAAFESGWGTSNLAKECRNYFGLTAYGCSNAYWHGGKTTVKASSYPLNFRRYDTRENSFLDFARLIRNGDNRETYRHSIIQITQTIQAVMALIGE